MLDGRAIGRRIVEAEQRGRRRADYGEPLIERLATDRLRRFGRGFSRQSLQQMRALCLAWPSGMIRQTPSGESLGRAALGPRADSSASLGIAEKLAHSDGVAVAQPIDPDFHGRPPAQPASSFTHP